MDYECEDIKAQQIAILQKQLDEQFNALVGIVAYLSLVTFVAVVAFWVWLFS